MFLHIPTPSEDGVTVNINHIVSVEPIRLYPRSNMCYVELSMVNGKVVKSKDMSNEEAESLLTQISSATAPKRSNFMLVD